MWVWGPGPTPEERTGQEIRDSCMQDLGKSRKATKAFITRFFCEKHLEINQTSEKCLYEEYVVGFLAAGFKPHKGSWSKQNMLPLG